MHDVRQYATVVNKMMVAQQTYFRTKTPKALEDAKRLEQQVRAMTKEILHSDQKELFS